MTLALSPSKATEVAVTYLQANVVPLIKGPPGIGKSAMVRKIAQDHKLKLIDLRLSQCDPTDLN